MNTKENNLEIENSTKQNLQKLDQDSKTDETRVATKETPKQSFEDTNKMGNESRHKNENKNDKHSSEYESSRHNKKKKEKRERHDSDEKYRDKKRRDDELKHSRHHKSKSNEKDESRHQKRSERDEKRSSRRHQSSRDRRSRSRSRSRDHYRREKDYKRDTRRNEKTNEIKHDQVKDSLDQKTVEILKTIEIPKEIRNNPDTVKRYQNEQLKKKAEEMTGVKIPTFYNTSAVNPLVLAEQQRKRKLLWSKSKDNENTSTKLVGKAIVESQDEKTAEKFRKLMGIKPMDEFKDDKTVGKIQTMQKQAFDDMDKEYEYARMTTHLNRGKGLGFASHAASMLMDANQRFQQFQ